MNKQKIIAFSSVLIIAIVSFLFFSNKNENYILFHLATAIPTDLTELYVIENPSIYSKETNTILDDIELSIDEKNELTRLINTIEVSDEPAETPSSLTFIAKQTLYTTSQFLVRFSLYQSENDSYYVRLHSILEDPLLKLKDSKLPEFYLKLIEKTPQ